MDPNKLVWFPDPKCGYSIGRIVDISQDNASVQPVAIPSSSSVHYELGESNGAPLEFAYKSLYPCDQLDIKLLHQRQGRGDQMGDVDDSCALIQLHEAALLENARLRFHRDKIYTYVAHILIAVNPYYEVPGLHSAEVIARYQGKSLGTMPPHVYAIGEWALELIRFAAVRFFT